MESKTMQPTDTLLEKYSNLPAELIDVIKQYTGEGMWRNGKFILISRIPRNDIRYRILAKRPRIKQVYSEVIDHPRKGSVWFKTAAGKFIVINVRNMYAQVTPQRTIFGCMWEMYYNGEQTLHLIR
jgi:hypothetical protein